MTVFLAPYWQSPVLTSAGVLPVIFIQGPEVSGLNGVGENGAVMLRSFRPHQFHPRVPNLFYPDHTGRPGNTWIREERHMERRYVYSVLWLFFCCIFTQDINQTTDSK